MNEKLFEAAVNNTAPKVFLTADWRHLAMLNYEVDPAVLRPLVPAGTELDFWDNKALVSVVGFLFQRTCIFGVPIPFHGKFEEVNLRFYVRRKAEEGWRRGVVFIKEIVPRAAVAFVARKLYNEPYIALDMAHRIEFAGSSVTSAEYSWQLDGRANTLRVKASGEPQPLRENSEAEFITQHFWGYTRQRDGSTLEYEVQHRPWSVCETAEAQLDCDVAKLYGAQFSGSLSAPPCSAFLAEGSSVAVYQGRRLP